MNKYYLQLDGYRIFGVCPDTGYEYDRLKERTNWRTRIIALGPDNDALNDQMRETDGQLLIGLERTAILKSKDRRAFIKTLLNL